MKFYITYGTYGYLHQIQLNHPTRDLFIFSGNEQSVMIEETDSETIFQQPKTFRVLTRLGSINSEDFHALISIPTTEDHKYQLEKKLESYFPRLEETDGFNSYRLLKPVQSNIYKVFFGFSSRKAYEDFKKSSSFREHFSKEAVRSLAGASSAHASYLEQYFYPISEDEN
ncbi:signal transduction protein TRAP [Staphylococcus lutrae]|uniref:Signal transduction protein TRAP n=1 Tax=Staphylococcus lutrae TaxID=155085 RepID=A0AAC9RRX0_9STAP|nr:signal transduction protein TRAP [Staphylococcus lutrae]ARJ50094.1 signal transduction protein TRAP [Staphylococcus lutrae]PNZ37057.1 signal transduction protein TRAP [Staphylococcus lutrae]